MGHNSMTRVRVTNPSLDLRPSPQERICNLPKTHIWGDYRTYGDLAPVVLLNGLGFKLPSKYLCSYP